MDILLVISIIIIIIASVITVLCITNSETFKSIKSKTPTTTSKSDKLYSHLKFTSELLKKNNIKHWIMYGTLLGGVRQGDVIPYDWDFDFGANVEDLGTILSLNPQIKQYGYEFVKPYRPLTKKDKGYNEDAQDSEETQNQVWKVSVKVKYNGKSMGDIYFYKKCDDGYMRRYDPNQQIYFWPKATFPAWFVDRLTMVKIRDSYFIAPRDPKILLQHWYGKTWSTPIKAKAQGGKGDKNSDYYGGAITMQLSFLTDHVRKQGIKLTPKMSYPIKYIVPKGQVNWMKENE